MDKTPVFSIVEKMFNALSSKRIIILLERDISYLSDFLQLLNLLSEFCLYQKLSAWKWMRIV